LAIECLQTVPNKPEPAQLLVKSLKAFSSWQSTLTWLKDPPAGYMLPPVDIMKGFDDISAKAGSGGFANEFDFGLAIVELMASAHDGHYAFRPDVFKSFGFRNRLANDIVSVSVDGIQVPKLYHYRGFFFLLLLLFFSFFFPCLLFYCFAVANSLSLGELNTTLGTPTMPRAISMINGRNAAELIQEMGLRFSGYQDPDSQWNSQMQNYANPLGSTFVAASLSYQGATLTITYENGEEATEANFAILRPGANFTGVITGEDYYNRFCNPRTSPTPAAVSAQEEPTPTPTTAAVAPTQTIQNYPVPAIRDSGSNTTSGYFLQGAGYDDVAVLAVSSFAAGGNMGAVEYLSNFQATVEKFLVMSKESGKRKLIIDLTTNGGGFVIAGYDLMAQVRIPDGTNSVGRYGFVMTSLLT
jgi:hypothetical protein